MEILIGLLSVAVAVLTLWSETKRTRLSQQADVIIRLADKFKDPSMRETRRIAAQKIISGSIGNDELSDILDFFTIVSILVKEGALELHLAYSVFDYWVIRYWECSKEHVSRERKVDPDSWFILERLTKRFYGMRKRDGIAGEITQEICNEFLQEEARVGIHSSPQKKKSM